MKARDLLIGAAMILVLGAASAGEPAIDEMIVTAKHATPVEATPVTGLDLQAKDVLSNSTVVIELPKIEVALPRLAPEHG